MHEGLESQDGCERDPRCGREPCATEVVDAGCVCARLRMRAMCKQDHECGGCRMRLSEAEDVRLKGTELMMRDARPRGYQGWTGGVQSDMGHSADIASGAMLGRGRTDRGALSRVGLNVERSAERV
jgi:hypothetical protein